VVFRIEVVCRRNAEPGATLMKDGKTCFRRVLPQWRPNGFVTRTLHDARPGFRRSGFRRAHSASSAMASLKDFTTLMTGL
jgi:hypothetical protein